MTSPLMTAHVDAELDWGDLDEQLVRRLQRASELAQRAVQRNFDQLAKGSQKSFEQIEKSFERQMTAMERQSKAGATKVNKHLREIDGNIHAKVHVEMTGATTKEVRSMAAALRKIRKENADPIKARVNVDVDDRDALRDLAATRRAMQAKASANPVNVPVRANRSLMGAVSQSITRIASSGLGAIGTLSKLGAVAGLATLAVGSLAPVVGALGAGLGAVAGAAAGGAVAGLFAVGIAAGALKTAFSGLGDAGKVMFDPSKAKEFEEALAALAPSAQGVMRAVQSLGNRYAEIVKAPVQEAFFSGLGPHIEGLSALLPSLRDSMLSVADGFNEGAKSALSFINSARGTVMVKQLFAESGNMAANLGSALGNLIPGLIAVGASASTVFGRMTDGLGGAARGLSDFLIRAQESGQMDAWFERMAATAKQVGQVLGQVGSAIGGIFKAAAAAGDGNALAGILGTVTKISDWTNGAGQGALTSFFESSTAAMGALVPVLLQVASVIGSTVAPIIADLAVKLGPVLVPLVAAVGEAIAAAAPQIAVMGSALAGVIRFITPIIPLLGPLLPAFAAVAGGIMLFSKIAGPLAAVGRALSVMKTVLFVLTPAVRLFGIALMSNPIGLIVTAVVALGVALWAFFTKTETGRRLWEQIWGAIRTAVSAVVDWFTGTAWPLMQTVFQAIGDVVMWLWNNVFGPAFNGIKFVISVWWAFAQIAFKTFMVVVQAIGGVVNWLWQNVMVPAWEGIKSAIQAVAGVVTWLWQTIFQPAFNGIAAIVGWAWDNIIKPALDGILAALGWVGDKANWLWQNVMVPAWEGIKSAISTVWDFIKPIFDKIGQAMSIVGDIAGRVGDAIKTAFGGVVGVLKKPINMIGSLLAKIPSSILGVDIPGAGAIKSWGETLQSLRTGGQVAGRRNGVLYGPGTGTSDSILGVGANGVPTAMVSAGEFVVNAKSTRRFLPILQAINSVRRGAQIAALAAGGTVGREPYGLPVGTNISYGAPGFPEWVYEIGRRFNVKPSTYAGHQERDGQNKGIDWSGSVSAMHKFAEWLLANAGDMEQVIWMNPETGQQIGVADGQRVGPGTSQPGYYSADFGGHQDHVHTRQSAAFGGGSGSGPGIDDTAGSLGSTSSASGGTPTGSGIGSGIGSGSGSGSSSWGNSGGGSKFNNTADAKRGGLTAVWVENWPASMGGGGSTTTMSSGTTSTTSMAGTSGTSGAGSTGGAGSAGDDTIELVKQRDGTYKAKDAAWDRLIQRESGGKADIVQQIQDGNSGGNEASGLFQIAKGTWAGSGGTKYAPTAGEATADEQALIAAKIFKRDGGSPWGAGRAGREDESALRAGITKIPTTPAGNVPVEVVNPGDKASTTSLAGTPSAPPQSADTNPVTTPERALPELSGKPSAIGGNLGEYAFGRMWDQFLADHPELSKLGEGLAGAVNTGISGQIGAGLGMFGMDFEPRWLSALNQYRSDNQNREQHVTNNNITNNIKIDGEGKDARTIAEEVVSAQDRGRKRTMRRYVTT